MITKKAGAGRGGRNNCASAESTSAAKDQLILERDTKAAIASPRSFLIKLREKSDGSFQQRIRQSETRSMSIPCQMAIRNGRG